MWVWCLHEEGEGEQGEDETWQAPILNHTDITPELAAHYFEFTITLEVVDQALFASAQYDPENPQQIEALSVWEDGNWVLLSESGSLKTPATLRSLAAIEGDQNVLFLIEDLKSDVAMRKSDPRRPESS